MYRRLAAKELSELMSVTASPVRIRIIEELGQMELTVGELQDRLKEPQAKVSQNLAALRNYRLVTTRRDGRFVYYRLTFPELAVWLMEGLSFIKMFDGHLKKISRAAASAKKHWS